MTSIQIDRTDGLSSSTAIKGPCKAATTANITLSGEQTIDGVSVVTGDRVLVKNQTSAVDNGIYVASTGVWARSRDFAGNKDVKQGTAVLVTGGATNGPLWWVTTANPIAIGTTFLAFGQNIQPYDPDLASWAAVNRAAGFDAFVATPSSANLKALVPDETGSGPLVFGTAPNITNPTGIVKGDVGLGNVDNTSDASKNSAISTLTNKRLTPRIGTTASSATPGPDGDNNDQFNVTALATGATFAAPTGTPTGGQRLIIRIKDNGSAQTLAFNAIYRAGTDVTLPTTTVISKTMYLGFVYNAADSKWDLVAKVNNI